MELVGLVAAGAAALALGVWRVYVTDARRLGRTAPVRIADFPDRGVARIVGRVRYDGAPLTAPLSRRPCVYFEAARLSDSDGPGESRRIARGRDFIVEDDSGRALVRSGHARVRLRCEHRGPPRVDIDQLRGQERADVEELCASGSGWRGLGEGYLFEEGIVGDGERVSVVGYGSWEPDPDPGAAALGGYRDTATRLVIQRPRKGELVIAVGRRGGSS